MHFRLVIALSLAASIANAAEPAGFDFATLDSDGSGGLSLAEMRMVAPDLTRSDFSGYDSDASGELSPTEFAVFVAERR